MTPDERTILLLAAKALRVRNVLLGLTDTSVQVLADALDRIAGAGTKCGRCGEPTTFAQRPICPTCWEAEPRTERVIGEFLVLGDPEKDATVYGKRTEAPPEPSLDVGFEGHGAEVERARLAWAFEGQCRCGFEPKPGTALLLDKHRQAVCPMCNNEWPRYLLPLAKEAKP